MLRRSWNICTDSNCCIPQIDPKMAGKFGTAAAECWMQKLARALHAADRNMRAKSIITCSLCY